MSRPGMVALLSFIDAQPNDRFVVIFDDLKRASRDTRAFLDLRDAFRRRGVSVGCPNFKFDDTPEGEYIETIIAAQGALGRKQNGRQVAQKMKARMENGYWIHNPPIGYRFQTIKGRGKVLVPNPPFDAIIKEAFEGYAIGRFQTQAEVKRFFESFPDFPRNKHGEIRQQRVTDIFTQPVYAGHICSKTYGINWLKAQHKPLVSLATFDKVQERRAGTAKAPKRADIGADFALRGMVTCACCGSALRSSWSKGKNKSYPYYLCQTKGCEAYGKSIPRDKIESAVGDLVKDLQPTPGLMTLAKTMFHDAWATRLAQAKHIQKAAQRQLAEIDKQIVSLINRIMDATNARVIHTYEDKIAELETNKVRLADESHNQTPTSERFSEKLEHLLTFLANPWKLLESGDIHLRRTVLKLAFADRLQYDRNSGGRTPKLSFTFKDLR